MGDAMLGTHSSPQTGSTETPQKTDEIADRLDAQLCKQLFNLQNGQSVELLFKDSSKTPDYHQEGETYVVASTRVTYDDGKENGYYVEFNGINITNMSKPHFKINMSRRTRTEMWTQCYILGRTGTDKWGNKEFDYRKAELDGIVVTEAPETCSECGQTL